MLQRVAAVLAAAGFPILAVCGVDLSRSPNPQNDREVAFHAVREVWNMPADEAQALVNRPGMSLEEFAAYGLVYGSSGVSLSYIQGLRDSGKSWEDVARETKASLGEGAAPPSGTGSLRGAGEGTNAGSGSGQGAGSGSTQSGSGSGAQTRVQAMARIRTMERLKAQGGTGASTGSGSGSGSFEKTAADAYRDSRGLSAESGSSQGASQGKGRGQGLAQGAGSGQGGSCTGQGAGQGSGQGAGQGSGQGSGHGSGRGSGSGSGRGGGRR